jgi:hypothetical protein
MQLGPCKQSEYVWFEKRGKRIQINSYYICFIHIVLLVPYCLKQRRHLLYLLTLFYSCEQLCQLLQEQDVEKRGLPEEEGEAEAGHGIFTKFSIKNNFIS